MKTSYALGRSNIFMALLAGVFCAAQAAAQDYPLKPVRLVDPYAPGGSTGVVSRVLARKFQEQTRQNLVIDNRPGAGSNIGSDLVAKAPPDGYTLLLGTSSLAINLGLYRSMPFDPIRDLAPIDAGMERRALDLICARIADPGVMTGIRRFLEGGGLPWRKS